MMRKLSFLLTLLFAFSWGMLQAQNVNINATGGTPFATYPTLNAAFTAINNGVHTGQILVSVIANTSEGATSAVLNASGTGAASYTKVYIGTTLSNAVVSGAPASGSAVVKLAGADNVTINGAQNASGTTRNLTIENTVASGTANTAAIWVQSAGAGLGCTNDTIMNCIIRGNDAISTVATSTFGIFAAGATIGTTGTGADNDGLNILNNDIRRCWVGIFARGAAGGVLDNLVIAANLLGNATQAESWGRNAIDIQQAASALIALNDVGTTSSNSNVLMFGIELGTGTTTCVVARNVFHDIVNLGSSGCWGINIAGGTGNLVTNNMVHNVRNTASSLTSGTTLAAGIRLNGGTGHQIYYNSVNLYGTTTHTGAAQSGALVINSAASVLNIRDNIFANSTVFPVNGSRAAAVIVGGAFNWSTSTSNYNGYFVPATNTATTTYLVGTVISTANYTNVASWQGYNLQDANSVPYVNQTAPFAANNNLHVTASPVIIESAGINIGGITTDFDNEIRQGNGGYSHVPAGTAPDIGADEIATTPTDFIPPSITGISLTPGAQCSATSHTVQATVTDASGLASVVIVWFIDGVPQADIAMTNMGGGVYSGVIPASGSGSVQWYVKATDLSPVSNISSSTPNTYQDAYLNADAGSTDSVCLGSSVNLIGTTPYGLSIKITEISQFSTGTGATNPYPSWLLATGFEDYIEVGNVGPVAVNLAGYTVYVEGFTTRQFTYPSGTILPAGGVSILHIGTGTDDPANLFFNMGGTNNVIQSGSLTGYYIKNPGSKVVDAVATNSYVFSTASGVTATDWSGNIPSSSARAGVIRTATDNNTAADWVVANTPTPIQTLGSMNPGLSNTQPTATWDFVTSNGFTTITPATSGYHYFSVNDGVCTSTDSVWIEVLSLPSAPATMNDTICGTDTLNLMAMGGSGTFNWYDQPLAGTLVYSGSMYMPVLNATDTFYVAENNGACEGNRSPVYAVVTPADSVFATPSVNPACQDEAVTLTASSSNATYVYTWTGPGLSGAPGSTVNFTATASDSYFLEAIDSAGCRWVDTVDLSVNLVGTLDIVLDDPLTCPGDSATLTAAFDAEYLSGPQSFTSYPGLVVTDNDLAGVYDTITVSGVYPGLMVGSQLIEVCLDSVPMTWDGDLNVFLITPCGDQIELTTGNGGSGDNYYNTCFTITASTSITAGAAPFSGSFLPEDANGFNEVSTCEANGNWVLWAFDNAGGDVAVINKWHITINSISHYSAGSWTSTSGFTSTNATITDAPAATTTYYYTIGDTLAGCSLVDSFTVTVPDPVVASAGGPSSACSGSSVDLTVGGTGGTGGYTVDWNGMGSNDTLNVTITSDTMFIVTLTDSCGNSGSDTVFVNLTLPVAVSISSDTTICEGDSVTLTANASDGDGNYTYSWSSGGSAATETVSPVTTTPYTVTVTDGCSSSATDQATVTVNPLPIAGFTFTPASPQEGQTVTFTNTSTNSTSWTWDFGDGSPTSNSQNPTHVYSLANNYTVTLIATNSCGSDTLTQTLTILTGLADALGEGTIRVSPNPGNGYFSIMLENLNGKEVNLQVFDLRGELIANQSLNVNGMNVTSPLDLTGFSKGVYLLKVQSGSDITSGRLVIQ